jgi:hypothetical protein
MGSEANRLRAKWQDYSGRNASHAEHSFFGVFREFFKDTDFQIRAKPTEFKNLYVGYELDEQTLREIYNPEIPVTQHGVSPDYAIDNKVTGKTIYVEVKRQDGWVEGGIRSDGRGNAHERSCKFFTPGLRETLHAHSNLAPNVLPFWVVFQGDITRDPCRVREITFWFGQQYTNHKFFWRDSSNGEALIYHFLNYILPLLE